MSSTSLSAVKLPTELLGNVFLFAQAGLLGSFVIVGIIAATTPGMPGLAAVVVFIAAPIVLSLIGQFAPVFRRHPGGLVAVAVADIVLVGGLREVLEPEQSGLTILVVIPVLWLSYSFGAKWVVVAFVGDYLVALFPFIQSGHWPENSADWGAATVLPAIVSVVAIAVHVAARRLRAQISAGLDAASAALAVVETVDAAITLYDDDGVILLTNEAGRVEAAARHAPDAVMEVFAADRVTPVAVSDRVVELAARGELVTRRLYWIDLNGTARAFMASSQYVRRASGEIIGTVIASHDVTPLAEAIAVRDQFLATVSHELRTPLTSILGYLEVIEDTLDLSTTDVAAEFAIVQRNSRRLERLIGDLLTTANEDAALERRPFDLSRLARQALDAVRSQASASGLSVSLVAPDPVIADVDADHIGSVLDKLLSNAITFSPTGGSIRVSVERDAGEAVIAITDTGPGIDEKDRPHVFERFYRGVTVANGQAGAGLGLSTAKVIVDAHGGTIDFVDLDGPGTCVVVRLPIATT